MRKRSYKLPSTICLTSFIEQPDNGQFEQVMEAILASNRPVNVYKAIGDSKVEKMPPEDFVKMMRKLRADKPKDDPEKLMRFTFYGENNHVESN